MILAMLADVIDHIEFKEGMRTDGLTMSIYSSIMVAGTPICNSIFSAVLNVSGYVQDADVALGELLVDLHRRGYRRTVCCFLKGIPEERRSIC